MMVAQRAGKEDHVSFLQACCAKLPALRDKAYAGGIDIDAALSLHHLGIPRHNRQAGFPGGLRHGGGNALEHLRIRTLLDEKAAGQIAGDRPAHQQVVDRPADRQPSNVAAGEKERGYHKAVGGKGQALRPLHHRRILHPGQSRIVKPGGKERLD